jgi:hypothetical protein
MMPALFVRADGPGKESLMSSTEPAPVMPSSAPVTKRKKPGRSPRPAVVRQQAEPKYQVIMQISADDRKILNMARARNEMSASQVMHEFLTQVNGEGYLVFRRNNVRQRSEFRYRISVRLSSEDRKILKVACARNEISPSELMHEFLTQVDSEGYFVFRRSGGR